MTPNRWTLLILSLCCSLTLLAQKPFHYDKAWQKIDSLIYKELPKSALAEVNKLYAQSVKDKQESQRLKAIICKGHLALVVEEESFKPVITQLEKELKTAKQPSQQILQSLLADVYLRYFEMQRWKIYDRKKTNSISSNPDTWSAEDFHQRIIQLYTASLKNPVLLQQTSIDIYEPILIRGEKKLRPTLYDVLAHKFLDYLQSDELDISEPMDAFVLNDAASLSMPKIFIRHNYSSSDSSNRVWLAMRLYQQLLAFHLNDADPSALIDADLSRYAFVQRESSHPYKKQLGKEWLENIVAQYPNNEMAAMAAVQLVDYWQELSGEWNPQQANNSEGKMALAIAAKMAKDISEKFPKTIAGEKAAYLYGTLTKPHLQIEVEQVNVLNVPFRAKLSFINTTKAYVRIIKAKSDADADEDFYPNDDWWSKIVKQAPTRQWLQELPAFTDLRQHSAEIAIDALPVGEYWLLASSDETFSTTQNALTAVRLYVSNISYVYNSNQHLFVLDRVTGKPLANAQVKFWKKNYDYSTRKEQRTFWQLLRTDKNGLVMIPKDKSTDNRTLLIEITHGNDHLFVQNGVYNTGYIYEEDRPTQQQDKAAQARARYFLFTDRGLYRPGQTVYFKAIGVTDDKQTGHSKLYLPKKDVLVNLFDANQHLIKSLKLMHNEFGSINGSFVLPLAV